MNSKCFDMHGGRDRKDGTNIAGTWLNIHHNTFRCAKHAVVIRGVPEREAGIHHNWFFHRREQKAVRSEGRTKVRNNTFGMEEPKLVGCADC